MRSIIQTLLLSIILCVAQLAMAKPLKVITTSSSYKPVVEYIGKNKVEVSYIIQGYQDPHIVRPKPSLAVLLSSADLLIATGLDLEAWLPALQDMAGNKKIMSGQPGYVSVSSGIAIMEKPKSLDRSEGDVHVFGNPHIHTSPINGKHIAENITAGLIKVDPENKSFYLKNYQAFLAELHERLYGKKLIRMLGTDTLDVLAKKGKLYSFLESKQYKGKSLMSYLEGWFRQALPLRGKKVVCYHKNWTYFAQTFGLQVAGYLEPKPGIPPSPGHVAKLINLMNREKVKVVLAANYFDVGKVTRVTEKTGARPVVVSLAVDGQEDMKTFFDQYDIWIETLVSAFQAQES